MALKPQVERVNTATLAIVNSAVGNGAMRIVNHTLDIKVLPSDRIAGSAMSLAIALQGFALGSEPSNIFPAEDRMRVLELLRASTALLEGTMV